MPGRAWWGWGGGRRGEGCKADDHRLSRRQPPPSATAPRRPSAAPACCGPPTPPAGPASPLPPGSPMAPPHPAHLNVALGLRLIAQSRNATTMPETHTGKHQRRPVAEAPPVWHAAASRSDTTRPDTSEDSEAAMAGLGVGALPQAPSRPCPLSPDLRQQRVIKRLRGQQTQHRVNSPGAHRARVAPRPELAPGATAAASRAPEICAPPASRAGPRVTAPHPTIPKHVSLGCQLADLGVQALKLPGMQGSRHEPHAALRLWVAAPASRSACHTCTRHDKFQ